MGRIKNGWALEEEGFSHPMDDGYYVCNALFYPFSYNFIEVVVV